MAWGGIFTEVESEGEDEFLDNQNHDQAQEEDSDEDIDYDISRAHAPTTSSEKRKAQNELFKLHAAKRTEEITKEEIKEVLQGDDEKLSIRNILAKQEASAQITNPRDYQTELFEKAKRENIIAVLDTGSGKTHIATLLLRHIIDQELEHRKDGHLAKISFFLVDSVNLVFQQANVLRCGLGHNVESICGAMSVHLWEFKTWEKLFTNNMVVVCTAEVLVQCMMHSFLTIDRINLLIFDEAHHAKKNHSYARLIKDFYLTEPNVSKRPRIFGMTASPVDAKVDVKQGAKDLETLLHCKIATTSDLALLSNHITRPEEQIVQYPKLRAPFETEFHKVLRERYGEMSQFKKFFDASKHISSELGRWAADVYWPFAISEEETRKLEMREQRGFYAQKEGKPVEILDEQIVKLREAADFVRGHEFGVPTMTERDLSVKVLSLYQWLLLYYGRTGEARCIIFVDRRYTARLLHLIFKHIGGPHMRSDLLVGVNSTFGDLNISLRNQVLTVAKFRRGELNCLFATQVAEEGLDIPQCNLVVRFDLYKTMISYVQSRGRARHRNSKYLHMMEAGNSFHMQAYWEARSSEKVMREFCQGLPSDRLIDQLDEDSKLWKGEGGVRSYTEPTTGARLTYGSSLGVVAHFVASLPQGYEVALQPHYIVGTQQGKFICEVILPDCSPIHSAIGRPSVRKSLAKRSAAFEMCIALRKGKYLDEHLLPIYTKKLPAMRNALLALSVKKKDLYPMRIKPDFWELGYGELPQRLYLTVLDVSAGLERPHQPIGLLTRAPFPQLPSFPIYLTNGKPTEVISVSLGTPFEVSQETVGLFTKLTLQVYLDIFAKGFEDDSAKMPYWIVPLEAEKTRSVSSTYNHPKEFIDWTSVHEVCEKECYRWTPETSHEFLADKYFIDIWDGGRRFYSIKVAPDLKPLSPVPEGVPRHKFMGNILDYSVSLWNKSRALRKWDLDQPVVEAERIPFRQNLLAPAENDEDEVLSKNRTFICPEPIRISALNTRFVAMCYTFPAIIHQFDSYMIALDACKVVDIHIDPGLALEALTKDSDNSDDHGEEKINFKSGMGPNYERLEFMGDCFLKMATSISIFVQQPEENEFEFHVRRMCLLCNKNLFKTALDLNLYEYIRTMAFSRRTWYPKGLKLLTGKGAKRTGESQVIKHSLGDKSIADVCEALIGAAFTQYNDPGAFDPQKWDEAVKAVKILVSSPDHLMEKYSDYYAAYEKPRYQIAEASASQLDLAAKIEKKHPYHFKHPRLLYSAFLHPSQTFMSERIPNYQRLEFLGDSLLDQVFIMNLFYRYPDKDPQWLTEHKMPMVSNKFLGAVCVKLGFHAHIRHNHGVLGHAIHEYVTEVQEAEREANGAVDYWVAIGADTPKCLADVVEAYVGAMFVDSEFDFSAVQNFFDLHLAPFMQDMAVYDGFANNHPTTRLTKLLQMMFGCREWRIATQRCPSVLPGGKDTVVAMVQIHWKICFDGTAISGRYARVKAAEKAVEALEGLPQYEFRRLYGCDCEDEGGPMGVEGALDKKVENTVGTAMDVDGMLNEMGKETVGTAV
ncbi:dicer-like protein 1 [Delitschia confertaspora ATCC 74209]|uniref:Dicer-like protein 1 n=1 Tax=Delitschia confertaspora ATCC 74209 TaxID=1513339 RepID=A0A9P4JKX5_9PLEO|nr:dicer-like protein 1 [Delitschia confertaspora ATCC 74209]